MTPENWERIESWLAAAIELPVTLRAEFIARVTAGDEALRAELTTLLAAHDENPDFLEQPSWTASTGREETAAPEWVGPYRIVRSLGRGGMGQVYLAERQVQDVTLSVAVKVMRRGMDTDDLLERFRIERQILASLNHPNIARLLDVGSTESGAPFLVMEYVEGTTLLEFADKHRLSVNARLALVQKLCVAVQHAHQRVVVHRDIKPQNILVTADGAPKLLDFGIAKLLAGSDAASSVPITNVQSRLLTPTYAAPEQMRGESVTTACDVYALGVLMYELLAGQNPFLNEATDAGTVHQRVLDGDAPPPSSVASETSAALRGVSAAALKASLRGDVDTIVGKSMHREPEQRYGSPAALEDDIARYLAGQPIRARPSSRRYRLVKFAKRNRASVAATTVLLVSLIAASVVTAYQARRIRQEAIRVAHERDKALEVRTFLLEMFGTTGPDQAAGDSVTARALLDRRAASFTTASAPHDATDADVRSEMLSVLAEGYEKLGLLKEAEPLARAALAERQAQFGENHPDVVTSHNQLGWILHQRRELPAAEQELRQAVAIGRRLFADSGDIRLARALNDLGVTREARGDYDQAAALYRESMAMRRGSRESALGTAITTSNLAVVLYRKGDLPAAITAAESALRQLQATVGDDHLRTTIVQSNLASMQSALGNHAAAALQHRAIVARRTRLFGAAHPTVASSLTLLANELAADTATIGEAELLLNRALAIQRAVPGGSDDMAYTLRVRGDLERGRSRWADALRDYQLALSLTKGTVGPAHERVAVLLARTALVHAAQNDWPQAIAAQREAVAVASRAIGETHKRTADMRASLARYESQRTQAPR